MKPALEQRAIEALDDAIADLISLKPLLKLAMARDDQPNDGKEKDPVHRTANKIVDNVLAIANGSANTLRMAKQIAKPEQAQEKRVASLPDCIVCKRLAIPRPKRGLCGQCYEAYRYSGFGDIIEFQREQLAKLAIEESAPKH